MPEASIATRVHVVGCPRSGTTLMTELLRYAYEFAGAADHERSLFDPIPAGLSPYLTKKPADTIRIQRAFTEDQNLHVIALIRDPRAVITSVHWSHPDQYFVGFKRWKLYADAIRALREHPRYLVLRYEDLLRDPAGIQSKIDTHLPFLQRLRNFEDYPQGVEALHVHSEKALGGVRPFDTARIDSWREHLGRVRKEFEANSDFQNELGAFGYEADASWTQQLDAVEPKGTSYKDAASTWPKSWEADARYWLKTRRYLRERT